ncbi:MAG: helix-turn-helix transcriptional regulator [Paracoccaceae bacterium]
MKEGLFVFGILLVQALCAVFFVSDIVMSVLGFRSTPIAWQTQELLEIGAAVGLVLGLLLGALALYRVMQRSARYRKQLRAASSAFMDLLDERFAEWGLTPAERDVALFAIKGFSIQDIAALRSTSDGTVKAQTAAIYRKAGVNGRPQLLSLFIDDLMEEGAVPKKPG